MTSFPVIACDSHAAYVSAIQAVDPATSVLVVPSMPVKRWVQAQFADAVPVCYTAAECLASASGVPAALLGLRQTCPDSSLLRTTFSTPESLMALFYWWRRFPDRAAHIPPNRLTGSVAALLAWLDDFERQYQPQWETPRLDGCVNAYIVAGSAWDYQRLVQVLADAGYALTLIQRRFLDAPPAGWRADDSRYYRCQTPMDEARLAMQTAVQQAASGIAWSDMVIVVPSIRVYGPIFEQVSAEYGVPVCGLPDLPVLQTLAGQFVAALLRAIQAPDPGLAMRVILDSPLCATYRGVSVDCAVARRAIATPLSCDPEDPGVSALVCAVQAWVQGVPDSADTLLEGLLEWLAGVDAETVSYYAMVAALRSFQDDYVDVGGSAIQVREDLLVYLSGVVVSRETSGVPVVSFLEGTGAAPSVVMVLGCDQDAIPRFESPTYLGRLIDEPDCVARYQSAGDYYSGCPARERWFSYATGESQLGPSRLFDSAIEWVAPLFQPLDSPEACGVLPDSKPLVFPAELALSATAMNAYAQCPQLYYYRYVLNLDGVAVDRLGVLWGVMVHRIAQVFLSGLSSEEGRLLATDSAQLRPALSAAIESVLTSQSWPTHGVLYVRQAWFETGLLDAFLASFERMGLRVFQTEYAFESIPLVSGATVSGAIDCILEDPSTGVLVVVDFKTGATVPSKKDSVTGKHHQLAVYVHVAQACFPDRPVVGACFWHIKDSCVEPVIVLADDDAKSTLFKPFNQRFHALDAAFRANQSALWEALVASIRSGQYGAPPNLSPNTCSRCVYQFMCPEIKWA